MVLETAGVVMALLAARLLLAFPLHSYATTATAAAVQLVWRA